MLFGGDPNKLSYMKCRLLIYSLRYFLYRIRCVIIIIISGHITLRYMNFHPVLDFNWTAHSWSEVLYLRTVFLRGRITGAWPRLLANDRAPNFVPLWLIYQTNYFTMCFAPFLHKLSRTIIRNILEESKCAFYALSMGSLRQLASNQF